MTLSSSAKWLSLYIYILYSFPFYGLSQGTEYSSLYYTIGLFYLSILCITGFSDGAVVKNPPANVGDARNMVSVPGWKRSPGGGAGNPLQYSYLEDSMDRGAWRTIVYGAAKSKTWLSIHAMPIYNSLHLLIPNSQPFLHLLPWQAQVCSLCLWTSFCFADRFIFIIFYIPHINDILWYLYFSFWLTSLIISSMIISRSILVGANGFI